MNKGIVNLQIGKNGLNDGIIKNLEIAFKTRSDIKIHVLKSGGHERETVKQMAEDIINKLGKKYTYRIVGFSIFIKKWKKDKR